MDSIEITILRTGAATAVAAKYLARADARVATICGCGNQGRVQLRALAKTRALERIFAFDLDHARAERFASELSAELSIEAQAVRELAPAVRQSDVCVFDSTGTALQDAAAAALAYEKAARAGSHFSLNFAG